MRPDQVTTAASIRSNQQLHREMAAARTKFEKLHAGKARNNTVDRQRRRAAFVQAELRAAGWRLVDANGIDSTDGNGWFVRPN